MPIGFFDFFNGLNYIKTKETHHKKYTCQNFEDLPLMLKATDLEHALGISRSSAYELMRKDGFPALWIEGRVVVPRDKFIEWVEQNTGK